MKADGIKQERETVIIFNELDDNMSVWTASDTIYRRLMRRLGHEYLTEDGERHAIFVCPKKLLIMPKKKDKRVLTEAQVSISREALAKAHLGRSRKRLKSISEG